MRFLAYLALTSTFILSSCSQGLEPHGVIMNHEEFQKLPNMQRVHIEDIFGKPQYVSSQDPKRVYYMGYKSENFYIFPSEDKILEMVEVVYDAGDRAKSCKHIPLSPQNINPESTQTEAPKLDSEWQALIGLNPMEAMK